MLIYNQNSPDITVDQKDETTVTFTLEHGIAFPVCEVGRNLCTTCIYSIQNLAVLRTDIIVDFLRNFFQNLLDTINAELDQNPDTELVIVDLKNAYTADVAAARTLRKISVKCTDNDIRLKIVNVNVSRGLRFISYEAQIVSY